MSDLLEQALRLSQRRSKQTGPGALSQVWWPDLAQPRPSISDDPPALLLEALLRRLLELAARNKAVFLLLVGERGPPKKVLASLPEACEGRSLLLVWTTMC